MPKRFSKFSWQRLQPPVRRVLAVDGGSRCIKLLLAQSAFGRFKVLQEELIDLQAEGLVAADEIKAHLQGALDQWGRPPLALALPQHLSISQVVELTAAPETEVEKLIADEIHKLGGVSDSRIVYDFVPLEGPVGNRQHFWVTLCQEAEIRDRLLRLGVEQEDWCEVTPTASALVTAFRAAAPLCSRAVLVHLGAQATVVVIVLGGQGVFATSFPMGGDFFTRTLARLQKTPEDAAERLKRSRNLLSGADALPEFAAAVDGWIAELKRQLSDWSGHNPALASELPTLDQIGSGGGIDQPGLLDYLKARGLALQPWPKASAPEAVSPSPGFEVAFGTALQALGYSPQPVSLLPEDYLAGWQKRVARQRIELAGLVTIVACFLLLAIGTWQKLSLAHQKGTLLTKVQAGQKAIADNDLLTGDLLNEYESLRPVLSARQNTLDILKTLALLPHANTNHELWYVLLADQQSYFRFPPALQNTNRPVKTNMLGPTIEPTHPPPVFGPTLPAATNTTSLRSGLIAELCVPGNTEASRQVLGELVKHLKQEPLFSKVDLLSDDLRRNLADPKVTVADRHYVLSLDFSAGDFQQPVRIRRPVVSSAPRTNPKRPPRSNWPGASLDEKSPQP